MTNKYLYIQFCYIFLCTLIFIMPIVRLDGWNNLQFKHTHSSRFSGGWIRRDKFIWRNPATKDVSKRVLKCRSQNSGGSPSSVLGMIQGSLHWYIRDRLDPWCQGKAGGGYPCGRGFPRWVIPGEGGRVMARVKTWFPPLFAAVTRVAPRGLFPP